MMKRFHRHGSMLIAVLALLAMTSIAVVTAEENITFDEYGDGSGYFVVADSFDGKAPVTVKSRFVMDSEGKLNQLDGIWLAGFSESPDAPPALLSVTWSEDTSGWFPTWGLQLQSDAGLVTSAGAVQQGAGFLAGSSYINLGQVRPEAGHVIEALLSYDPTTGRADVGVTDLTDNRRLLAKTYELEPYDGVLYPVVGYAGVDQDIVLQQFESVPFGVPAGSAWDLMIEEDGTFRSLVLSRFTVGPEMALSVGPSDEYYGGTYELVAESAEETVVLVQVDAKVRAEAERFGFSSTELPLGRSSVQYRYVDEGGNAWTIGSTSLQLVEANLHIAFGEADVVDGVIEGTLEIRSDDETLRDLGVQLYAAEYALNEEPGANRKLVHEFTLDELTQDPVHVEFSVPLESDSRVLGITLDIEFDTEVGKIVRGNEYFVIQ